MEHASVAERFRITVVGRLKDHKMRAKLEPLLAMPEVEEVVLVRRTPITLPRVRNYCPPRPLRGLAPLAELWRLGTVLWLAATGRTGEFLVSFYLLPHALYADVARRLFGGRTVPVTLSEEDVKLGIRRWPFAPALRAAHAVGVRGDHSARILESHGIPAARIFQPPNLFDPDDYAPDPAVTKDIDVLYVGNLVAVKRLDVLLDALARLRADRPSTRAVIVGDGVLRARLQEHARRLGLEEAVDFAGARPFEEVASWLRRSRVFVMTSAMEGLPQAMIESMSCGVPPVVPATGDVTTLARHGQNAWVVDPPSADEFARALRTLLEDAVLHRRLVEGCLSLRESFRRDYGMAGAIEQWRKAFAR